MNIYHVSSRDVIRFLRALKERERQQVKVVKVLKPVEVK